MHNSSDHPDTRNKRIEELEGLLVETERQLINLHRGGDLVEQPANEPPPPPPPNPPQRSVANLASLGAAEMWLRIGGIAMVVASAIFFVSTAIHRGWIGPTAQLVLATLVSLSFIALSFRFTSERRPWSIATAIGGASSLYASGVVGFVGLDLLSLPITTGWFVVSILTFLGLALLHDAQSLVVASAPASMIGLVLISAGTGLDPLGVSLLAAAYLVAVTLTCHERGWMFARTIGVILGAGAGGIALVLAMVDNTSAGAVMSSTVVLVVAVLIAAISQSVDFSRFELSADADSMTTPIGALIEARVMALAIPWTSLLTALAIRHLEITDLDVAWMTIALAIGLGSIVLIVPRVFPLTMQLLHGVAALATVTVGFVSLLHGPVLLVALLGQAVATTILALRFRSMEMIIAATMLATAVSIVTAGLLFYGTFVNGFDVAEAISVGLVISTAGIAAWLLNENEVWVDSWIAPWLLVLGWASATFRDVPQGQMVVTLIWALTGAAMVYVGATAKRRHLAGAGLLTLTVTSGKLVFVDLATVDVLWRAGLFFAVGAVFLRLGFVLPALLNDGRSSPEDDAEPMDGETSSAAVGIG